MNRRLTSIGALWACVAACSTPDAPHPPTPAASPSTPSPTPPVPSPVAPEQLEVLMLACDGPALAELGSQTIAATTPNAAYPSAQLLAHWESARSFDETGHLERKSVDDLIDRLSRHLEAPVPKWWADHLASALRRDGQEPPYYDGRMGENNDRRGPWRIEHGVRVRGETPSPLVVHEDSKLTYDFSMGRATLASPVTAGHMIEYDRAHAGATIYFAAFDPSAGGFPFPLVATGSDGTQVWSATVCGPNRTVLGGIGHLMAEVRVLEDAPPASEGRKMRAAAPPRGVAVFTAETHGVALEVFDIKSGSRTFAWSSDLWFARATPLTP